jgi:hypothetical protein
MKTSEFISALRTAPEKQLIFADGDGRAVHAGYHLTELKAAKFNTVDCGGQVNQWDETLVQLWVPANADDGYMTAAKFLKIFDKVRGMVPINPSAEIRVEYGDENFFPSIYYIRSISHDSDTTRVLLEPPATSCKARDRRIATSAVPATSSCCPASESCCAA